MLDNKQKNPQTSGNKLDVNVRIFRNQVKVLQGEFFLLIK